MQLDQLVILFITLGLLFLIGLATDVLGQRTRLPRVTLLLLFGLAIGPDGLALLPSMEAAWTEAVSRIALVMVGFLLGEKLTVRHLRRMGHMVLSVSLLVTLVTVVMVFAGLVLLGVDWRLALLLGGMATATDPAATVDVVHEARASGHSTRVLLGSVALDDVWGLLIFSFFMTLLVSVNGGVFSLITISHGLWDIGGSIAVGLGLGIPMALLCGRIRPGEPTQAEALGFVFLCAGIAMWLDVSYILAAIVLGMTVANLARHHKYPFHEIEGIEWPFLILFFVLAGAALDWQSIGGAGLVLFGYIVMRVIGRLVGGWLGVTLVGGSAVQKRWMGAALLPQAGVAVGMALVSAQRFPEYAEILLSIAVAGTVVFELLGPIFTRLALVRLGEAEAVDIGASVPTKDNRTGGAGG